MIKNNNFQSDNENSDVDLTSAKLKAAVKTLEVKRYTYHGGEVWMPPVGEPPKSFCSMCHAPKKEDPTPLKLADFKEMDGMPVYCIINDISRSNFNKWYLINYKYEYCIDNEGTHLSFGSYGSQHWSGWLAYRWQPEIVTSESEDINVK